MAGAVQAVLYSGDSYTVGTNRLAVGDFAEIFTVGTGTGGTGSAGGDSAFSISAWIYPNVVANFPIVNKDGTQYKGRGEKYLQTSVAHEYTQIINMAVDNVKSGILVNVAGAKNDLWFTEKMFEVVNPEVLPV